MRAIKINFKQSKIFEFLCTLTTRAYGLRPTRAHATHIEFQNLHLFLSDSWPPTPHKLDFKKTCLIFLGT